MLGGGGLWIGAAGGGGGGSGSSAVTVGSLVTMNATTGWQGQLFYNTTYNAFFQWVASRWWPFGNPDPRYGFVYANEEFGGTDRIGVLDWNTNNGTISTTSAGSSQVGVFLIRQATAGSVGNIRMNLASYQFGGGDYYIESSFAIPTAATAAEDFCALFGWNDVSTFDANGAAVDGAYFTINRAVNGSSAICVVASNSVKTSVNTSSAIDTGFHRYGIMVLQSSVIFSIDNVQVATIQSNMPVGAGRSTGIAFKVDKTLGTANSDITPDYFAGYGFFNTPRVP